MRVPEGFRVVEKASAMEAARKSAWKPSRRDEQIYEWVRFGGKSQGWVAANLELSQGTVSRVVQRYEKWLAHTRPQDAGRLDHDERLRVQRILTYDRNERILASCLRIAGEMEGFVELSKCSSRRKGLVGEEFDKRFENAMIDRSGTAARFLRLAFRVNMEQLKLVELEPLADLPELAAGEVDDVNPEADERPAWEPLEPMSEVGDQRSEVDLGVAVVERSSTTAGGAAGGFAPLDPSHPVPNQATAVKENCDQRCSGAHNAHERITAENAASADLPVSYVSNGSTKKTVDDARIAADPPQTPEPPRKRPPRVFHGGMPSGRPTS